MIRRFFRLNIIKCIDYTDLHTNKQEQSSMSELDIQQWLKAVSKSVAEHDIDGHMDLVSHNVQVYGLPSGATIDYQGWKKRRQSEFKRGLIHNISYNKPHIKNIALKRLIFEVQEITDASNGETLLLDKKIVLEKEHDGKWRVVEETINNWQHIKAKASKS